MSDVNDVNDVNSVDKIEEIIGKELEGSKYMCRVCNIIKNTCTFCDTLYCPRDFKIPVESHDVCIECYNKVLDIHRELKNE